MAKFKPWILVDPVHKDPATGGPLFADPDGSATDDVTEAATFDTEDEAKERADELKPDTYIPKPLGDYHPPKKPAEGSSGRARVVRPWAKATLTEDASGAHITADPEQSDELYDLFLGSGIACELKRKGVADLDVIDFGNPSEVVRGRMRKLFADWQKRNP
jgi:hypothetical protein